MRIADAMTPEPITVRADASATTAAKIMRDHDLGSLPVVENDRLVGFLTDRDIIVRCVANENECASASIGEIMSPDAFCCRDDQSPDDVMRMMSVKQVYRMPVIDGEDRLVGIVTLGALAERSGEPEAVCSTIKAVRSPVNA